MSSSIRTVGLVAAASGLVAGLLVMRRKQRAWGATSEEVDATLPGDDILGPADFVATRAARIQATPEDVWPWIAQLGQDRGGFYTYEALQALAGLQIRNADEIVQEWQHISPGDAVHLHPQLALGVAVVEPERALVLHATAPEGDVAAQLSAPPFDFTWAFVLRPGRKRGSTRLLVRERYAFSEPSAAPMIEGSQMASFIMTLGMLKGIKERAERRPRPVYVPTQTIAPTRTSVGMYA